MAYAYSEIDNLLGQQGQQNQNIFQQGAEQQSAQQQSPTTSQADVKTTTEGDINAVQSSSNDPSGSRMRTSSDQQGRASAQRAISANLGKTATPGAVQGIQEGIDQAKAGLAQRATQYKADQQAANQYNVDQGTLDKAVSGDSAAAAKTSNLLTTQAPRQVGTFDQGDLNVKNADLLNTNAGIKNLVSRGQDFRYTPGMAAFDSMLLQGDPRFRQMVSDIKGKAGALKKEGEATKARVEKEAADEAAANLASSQKSARDYLGGLSTAISDENAREAAAANAAVSGLDKSAIQAQALKDQQASVKAALDSIYGQGRADKQLAEINVDPSQFINYANYDPSQFWSGEDASRMNSINQLLGIGGKSAVASGQLGSQYNIDQTGLYNALMEPASAARQAADVSGRQQIQDILGAAQKRGDEDDYRRAGLSSNYLSDLIKATPALTAGSDFSPYRSLINEQTIKDAAGRFTTTNPAQQMDLGAMDVLNQAEVDQLNALAGDIGDQTRYQAGSYQSGGPQSLIDTQAYRSSLQDFFKNYQAQKDAEFQAAQQEAANQGITQTPSGAVYTRPLGTLEIGQTGSNQSIAAPDRFTFVGNQPVWDTAPSGPQFDNRTDNLDVFRNAGWF